jgi:hypothetical protein
MKPSRERNYYELLEVPTRASAREIRAAYQSALDRSAGVGQEKIDRDHLEELRGLLGKAVSVLTDSTLRLRYDRSIGLDAMDCEPGDYSVPAQLAMTELLWSATGSRLPLGEARLSYLPLRSAPRDAQLPAELPIAHLRANGHSDSKPADLEHASVLAEESAIANAEAALLHASARGQQLRLRPVEISPDADFNGELLRRVRESRGLVIQEVAERTRIPVRHLENIEADRYNHLPAIVYLRGILMSLARELRLEPVRVSRSYIAHVSETKAKGK